MILERHFRQDMSLNTNFSVYIIIIIIIHAKIKYGLHTNNNKSMTQGKKSTISMYLERSFFTENILITQ